MENINVKCHQKLKAFMENNNVSGKHLVFIETCHSVEQAAKASGQKIDNFVKNICMIDVLGRLIVAIVKGKDRASTSRVATALGIERPRLATPEEILERTGFPCGGTPSFGFEAIFLVDHNIIDMDNIVTGGGSEYSLVVISTKELLELNQAKICRIRK